MKMKIVNILLVCLIASTPLILQFLDKQKSQRSSSLNYKYGGPSTFKEPKVNDLHLFTDTSGITTYLKISGTTKKEDSFILLHGKETLEEVLKPSNHNNPLKSIEHQDIMQSLIQSNIGYSDSIRFIPRDSLFSKTFYGQSTFTIYRMFEKEDGVYQQQAQATNTTNTTII